MSFADGFAMKAGMIAAEIATGFVVVIGFAVCVFLLAVWLDIKSRKR